MVIFGASGDLTSRKLMPALYRLFQEQKLPEPFAIFGAARTNMDRDAFRKRIRAGIFDAGMNLTSWDGFAQHIHYHSLNYAGLDSYRALKGRLEEVEADLGLKGNRLYNLAIPPELYGTVAQCLARAGLSREDSDKGIWTRLVVEKPFGRDLASARRLNEAIRAGFKETQVFRIDHYLSKETVQNILLFRFANAIFEPLWNRNYIEYIRINAGEILGVEHRSGYYEQAGVLRDMCQNHMMQLLALVAIEPPSLFTANRVRDKKSELFRSLRPFSESNIQSQLVIGQYAKGVTQGVSVPGYREEMGVHPESRTPTYALLKLFVDNWRWQGVPFYITTGKRLRRKVTRIDVQFKGVPYSMFRNIFGEEIRANRLVMGIHPKEEIFLNFQAKRPGTRLCMRTAGLHFSYYKRERGSKADAYGKAISDAMAGDQTLFWRQDGLELAWAFLEPIIQWCEDGRSDHLKLHPYPAGSMGPDAALELLPPGSWPEKPV
jgi:glucose-6-phosphate 1-dehydrogenase